MKIIFILLQFFGISFLLRAQKTDIVSTCSKVSVCVLKWYSAPKEEGFEGIEGIDEIDGIDEIYEIDRVHCHFAVLIFISDRTLYVND